MPKVTLINIRISNTVFMPLGIMYLASVLENNGFKVQLIDSFTYETEEKIIKQISDFDPGYIGFSIVTPSYQKAKKLRQGLEAVFPDKVYFAGGIHPTILPEKTLGDLDMDFVVRGEGEYSLLEALAALESKAGLDNIKGVIFKDDNGVIKHNPERELINNLDEVPFPQRHSLDIEKYFIPPGYIRSYFLDRIANVLTSRGCPMRCTFCCSHLLFSRRVRKRSIGNVMQEVDLLIKDYRVNGFYFSDETFTIDYGWTLDFCKEIKKRGLPWGCATRIDTVDDSLLEQMKRSGCIQVDLGVESGSNRILKIIKKNMTDQEIVNTFSLFKKNRLRTFATFMIGNPTETKEDIIKTRDMVKLIKPSFALFSWFTPFPGTEAYEWMIKDKNINPDKLDTGYDFITSDKPMVNITDMSMQELVSSRSLLQRSVFLDNYFSMASFHNLKFICDAFLCSLLAPLKLLKALRISFKRGNLDHLVYFIFYNYQKFKFKKIVQ